MVSQIRSSRRAGRVGVGNEDSKVVKEAGLRLRFVLRYGVVGKWASNFACYILVLSDTLLKYGRMLEVGVLDVIWRAQVQRLVQSYNAM